MPDSSIHRATDLRDLDRKRKRGEARRLAQDIALRHPKALALARTSRPGPAAVRRLAPVMHRRPMMPTLMQALLKLLGAGPAPAGRPGADASAPSDAADMLPVAAMLIAVTSERPAPAAHPRGSADAGMASASSDASPSSDASTGGGGGSGMTSDSGASSW